MHDKFFDYPAEPPYIPYDEHIKRYTKYLKSPVWKAKRAAALKYRKHTCQRCGMRRELEVHHIHYRTLGHESIDLDLRVLCKTCHHRHHRFYMYETERMKEERYIKYLRMANGTYQPPSTPKKKTIRRPKAQ